jgi:hypothetical protein
LRKQLVDLLNGGNTHMPFQAAVADFPPEAINQVPPNLAYSTWQLLEHLRITQRDILDFIRNPPYLPLNWPADYWPPKNAQVDETAWHHTIQSFREDSHNLENLVLDPATDLIADLPHAPGYTILREILVVADHNAYHIGELAILRQVMNTWPANYFF